MDAVETDIAMDVTLCAAIKPRPRAVRLLVLLATTLSATACVTVSSDLRRPLFPQSVFGDRATFDLVSRTDTPVLYRLSSEKETKYFAGERAHIINYPIKRGPVKYDADAVRKMLNLVTAERSYQLGAQLGCGIPSWDAMLTMSNRQERVDLLLWFQPCIVRVLRDGVVVGEGWLGNAQSAFTECGRRLFPDESIRWREP